VLAAFQQKFTHFNARPVASVDTTGAGDAFVAGLLASLAANGMPTDEALEPTLTLAQTCGPGHHSQRCDDRLAYQRDLNRQF
jgi:fructokinase